MKKRNYVKAKKRSILAYVMPDWRKHFTEDEDGYTIHLPVFMQIPVNTNPFAGTYVAPEIKVRITIEEI